VDGVSTTAFTNVDAVRTRGVTLAYQQANTWLSGLDVSGSATYADPRVIKDTVAQQANPSVNYAGKVYPGVPKWRATGVMTYHPSDKWALTLAARYSGHQAYTLENTESTTDLYGANSSFFVVDVRASWQVREGLRLALGVDNLNNEAYYAYHPMPQRTIHAELKASF
jgi:iron complex outermembrane receptor protein